MTAASVTAIGAFRAATIGFFEFATKNCKTIPVEMQSEVLSMIGDIAVDDAGKASLHLHVVLGFSDGSKKGGHFIKDHVRPTLEVVLRKAPADLRPGIALISVSR